MKGPPPSIKYSTLEFYLNIEVTTCSKILTNKIWLTRTTFLKRKYITNTAINNPHKYQRCVCPTCPLVTSPKSLIPKLSIKAVLMLPGSKTFLKMRLQNRTDNIELYKLRIVLKSFEYILLGN